MTRYVEKRREDIKLLSVADMFEKIENERDRAKEKITELESELKAAQAEIDAQGVLLDRIMDVINDHTNVLKKQELIGPDGTRRAVLRVVIGMHENLVKHVMETLHEMLEE